jgi:hypothetical protein
MPPSKIYKTTVVFSLNTDGSCRTCLYKHIDVIPLPQPRNVQFKHTVIKGNAWEEYVWWFWDEDKAVECLMNAKSATPLYIKPAWAEEQKKALDIRIKNVDKELQRLKKEREIEKRIEQ